MQPLDQFEAYRPLMFSIAYRMLGSAMEAEDMVQETYLRYQTVKPETIRSPKAFLSAVITRLCLNQLELARTKREVYVGEWLPEPISTDNETLLSASNPSSLYDSISMGFMVLLENLTPLERAVFLLRQVFDYDYNEIADILGKEAAACRQLFSRAQKHIDDHRPRFKPTPEAHQHLLGQFLQTVSAGDMDGFMALLAQDVTLHTDGGGKAKGAATRILQGVYPTATFILSSLRLQPDPYTAQVEQINGEAAVVLRSTNSGKAVVVVFLETSADKIQTIRIVGNPDKLQHV
ncbi:MAG: RNA polymerase sigma-70 factor [Anaerolineaceae bacterium]|nr:RNA polymerase sigma-70 factor [Anaerolineaceae bacterium]